MARVTVEDSLLTIPNVYGLIRITSRRAKQILGGSMPLVESKNRSVVTALREIAAGKVVTELAPVKKEVKETKEKKRK